MKRINLFIAVPLLVMVLNLSLFLKGLAQDAATLISLKEAVHETLNNNSSLQLSRLNEKIATANFKQTEAIFLPSIGVSYTAFNTNNPLNAFGFKLQEQSIQQNDFNPQTLNHPGSSSDFTARLELQQPLVNLDLLYKRKAAEKQIQSYQLQTLRTREALQFETEKAFYQLQLSYESIQLLEESHQHMQNIYTVADNYFKQGLIQKSDLLSVQVQVTGIATQLEKAKHNVLNASDYLNLLMGRKAGVMYKPVNQLEPYKSGMDSLGILPKDRADFLAMEVAIDATGLVLKSDKMGRFPKLNGFGAYQLNDRSLLGFGARGYLLGLQLSWSLFNGNNTKNTIITHTLERDKLKEELVSQRMQAAVELNKAVRDLSNAQFEISQSDLAVNQAAEALHILQNRYQQGLVNTTEMLQAATVLAQQKFARSQAVYAANISNAYIQFLTTTGKQ